MKKLRSLMARPAAIAGAALALTVIVVACTAQPSGSPTSPSASLSGSLAAQPEFKGVVCHADGQGRLHAIEIGLGVAEPPPFSNNGHLDVNGNPESGHEDDFYLGPSPPFTKDDDEACEEARPSPTPTP